MQPHWIQFKNTWLALCVWMCFVAVLLPYTKSVCKCTCVHNESRKYQCGHFNRMHWPPFRWFRVMCFIWIFHSLLSLYVNIYQYILHPLYALNFEFNQPLFADRYFEYATNFIGKCKFNDKFTLLISIMWVDMTLSNGRIFPLNVGLYLMKAEISTIVGVLF